MLLRVVDFLISYLLLACDHALVRTSVGNLVLGFRVGYSATTIFLCFAINGYMCLFKLAILTLTIVYGYLI
jgi:predicted membrane-bound spermidine synthase